MRHTLRTEVDIAATPDAVWRCLTNFADYPHWNPFITSVVGVAAVGKCANCGKQIPSQTQKLCVDCSRKLGQCETCRGPLAPATQPGTRPAK